MGTKLWEPSQERIAEANLTRFMQGVNAKLGLSFATYPELYRWSVENAADFWQSMWEFGEIKASRTYSTILENPEDMLNSRWFVGAELNFAEHLLRYRDDRPALVFRGEGLKEPVRVTYAGLYDQVARLAQSLRLMGVKAGDRVAGLMPNMIETVAAMLAAASIGAIWSSCSPDFGAKGVLERFSQIEPKVLFAADCYFYNGKRYDSLERVKEIVTTLGTIEKTIVISYTGAEPELASLPNAVRYKDFLAKEDGLEIEFAQLPFDHPLYILFSSGTTGVPKSIVHRAGGVLLQHLKEHLLHTDLSRDSVIFYYTTCGWMMWNWLVSSLAVGAKIVLYDGSPFYPKPDSLWKMAQDEGITVFGTSAKFIAGSEKEQVKPGQSYDLSKLKTILSTGSPLAVESFEYVYRDIKADVCLSSISGGTDIVSCFMLGNPIGPVFAGEVQCRGLGMKVESFRPDGTSVVGEKGELVCTAPFPSMPLGFWHDQDRVKYKEAYFNYYPNIWRHGDFVEITATGGVIIYGRSDATLNPGGVRIGTAEIYRQVETLPEVVDSIVIGQDWENDVRVVLFVKLAEGKTLEVELVNKIKATIRQACTARHVPAKIIAVADIPYTLNGKKVELAVRSVVHNEAVRNQEALANPKALELFRDLPELQN